MTTTTLDLDQLHLCGCGCGEPAPLAKRTNARLGHIRGRPLSYISGHNRRGTTDLTRYTILPNGCWRWDGSVNRKGYGRAQVDGEHTGAHRAIYEARYGRLPRRVPLDHYVCDTPGCVNPDHVRPSTAAQNNRRTSRTRLSLAAVAIIRASDEPAAALAARFRVARQTVSDVRRGTRWINPEGA